MNKGINSDFIILGINWEQNSTASLMINGEIVGSASEERFSKFNLEFNIAKHSEAKCGKMGMIKVKIFSKFFWVTTLF